MTPPDRILASTFKHGLVRRDGTVVGCWLTRDVAFGPGSGRSSGVSVVSLMRMPDGRVSGFVAGWKPSDGDVLAWVRARHVTRSKLEPQAAAMTFVGWLAQAATDQFADATRTMAMVCLGQAIVRGLARGPVAERAVLALVKAQSATFGAFVKALDRDLVATVLDGLDIPGLGAFGIGHRAIAACWDGLDRNHHPDAPLRRAIDSLPLHSTLLADAWALAPDRLREAVRLDRVAAFAGDWAVERGILPRRLLPALGHLVGDGCGAAFEDVRSGVGLSMQGDPVEGTGHWKCGAIDIVRKLRAMPASWVPDGPTEWKAFASLAHILQAVSGFVRDEAGWSTFLNRGASWGGLEARLLAATEARHVPIDPTLAYKDLDDMCNAFARQVLVPATVGSGIGDGGHAEDDDAYVAWRNAAFSILFSGRSLVRMFQLSRDWHRRQNRMRADIVAVQGSGHDPLAWPAGLPEARFCEVVITVPTDEAQLGFEGADDASDGIRGLDHCVGGYGHECRATGMRILSLRAVAADGSCSRLSTAEVAWTGRRLDVRQHRGFRNGPPPDAAVDALRSYAEALANGALQVDCDGLLPFKGPERMVDLCGFDHGDSAARAAVRRMWGRYLPGTVTCVHEEALALVAKPLASVTRTWSAVPCGTGAHAAPESARVFASP